jgi:hypothetical protein
METTVLQLAAAVAGLFVGTFLVSRVGTWIEPVVTAFKTRSRGQTTKNLRRLTQWISQRLVVCPLLNDQEVRQECEAYCGGKPIWRMSFPYLSISDLT